MIWLIGNKGMLGSEVERELHTRSMPHVCTDLEVDITDGNAIQRYVDTLHAPPAWIINCAAYTAVDKAETDEERAFGINAQGVKNIGLLAASVGATVIHLSTDYVFDGRKDGAYTEGDRPSPTTAYGRSKLAGEQLLASALPNHFIIRTSWLFGARGPNFVSTMLRLFSERETVHVVNDQWGCPTYAVDLAQAITLIVASESNAYGTYHYSNQGRTTWFTFARTIRDTAAKQGLLTRQVSIEPITTDEYPTPAQRPLNSVLATDKIRRVIGARTPPWQDALERYIEEIRQ